MRLAGQKRRSDKNALTEEEIAAQTALILEAGQDTTANTLAFGLLELARAPELQEKPRAEIHSMGGSKAYDSMPLLNVFIKVCDLGKSPILMSELIGQETLSEEATKIKSLNSGGHSGVSWRDSASNTICASCTSPRQHPPDEKHFPDGCSGSSGPRDCRASPHRPTAAFFRPSSQLLAPGIWYHNNDGGFFSSDFSASVWTPDVRSHCFGLSNSHSDPRYKTQMANSAKTPSDKIYYNQLRQY
ncbi:hypothetical protein B0H13DRAFT_1860575 [Mycena leptocephala]|nr:hypothetical protein B0H13DRAFT_1860575 [Mycena leptocephala]